MLIDELYKNCFDGDSAVLYCDDDMNIYLDKAKKGYEIFIDDGQYVQVEIKLPKGTDYEIALLHIIKELIDKCKTYRNTIRDYEFVLTDMTRNAEFMIKQHKEDK